MKNLLAKLRSAVGSTGPERRLVDDEGSGSAAPDAVLKGEEGVVANLYAVYFSEPMAPACRFELTSESGNAALEVIRRRYEEQDEEIGMPDFYPESGVAKYDDERAVVDDELTSAYVTVFGEGRVFISHESMKLAGFGTCPRVEIPEALRLYYWKRHFWLEWYCSEET